MPQARAAAVDQLESALRAACFAVAGFAQRALVTEVGFEFEVLVLPAHQHLIQHIATVGIKVI